MEEDWGTWKMAFQVLQEEGEEKQDSFPEACLQEMRVQLYLLSKIIDS